MPGLQRRWLHPQAVPRGFLRMYILNMLSHSSESGYSIMLRIDERTDGAWRPGPGTMYPLLKGLVADGFARVAQGKGAAGTRSYAITPRGRRELTKMKDSLASLGRKERVIGRLFSDLLPAASFVPAMVNRYKEGIEMFRQKVSEVPQPDRDTYLKDMRLFMESQIEWIDAKLEKGHGGRAYAREGKVPNPATPMDGT
jgi:DNA-binding PadR family transcriptional regulator